MRFRATIQGTGKTAAGIQVPNEVVEALGPSRKPAVRATINGFTYRSSVASMGGVFMLGVSNEVRRSAGVEAGQEVDIDLELDTEPREVVVPADLAAALAADDGARRSVRGTVLQQQATDRHPDRGRQGARDAPAPDRQVDRGAPRGADLSRVMTATTGPAMLEGWIVRSGPVG